MKQGSAVIRTITLLLLAAVLLYLGVSAWNSLQEPFSTFLSYTWSVDDTVECTGYVVREETVLTGGAGLVDLLPNEGEKVAKGETVAMIYQSEAGLDRRQSLQALLLEREQLQYALQHLDGGEDSAQLSQQVVESITNLRASLAAGDLGQLEEQAMSLRFLVYRRELTYDNADAASTLAESIQSVDQQLSALRSQAAQDTAVVSAQVSGVFSGQADGYEDLLRPEMLEELTLSDLRAVSAQRPQAVPGAVGKLITSSRWYFVCPLSQEDAARLTQGRTVTVRFSLDWAGEVDMTVERIGDSENGQCLTVLSTDRYLSDTTLLREQTVELVFDTVSGIRVPKGAIRVGEQTRTDPDTGEETQVNVTCVYALVGSQAELKPVEVLVQRDDYCLVEGIPSQSAGEARKILRAGDEIIVAAEDLFDGKVVR